MTLQTKNQVSADVGYRKVMEKGVMGFLGQLLRSCAGLGKSPNLPHSQLPIGNM